MNSNKEIESIITILKVKNLSLGYHSKKQLKTVAQDINFDLQSGKLIALIGANGVGKSTLLKTITGIIPPISGEVTLFEKNLHQMKPSELARKLSVVLTNKLPPSNLTVYELVALGRQPYTNWLGKLAPLDQEKVDQAIAFTNLEALATKKHNEISDGQLQTVLIARALAQDTPFIILDEPTTHLDLVHRVQILKLLKKLTQETNKCILFSTHDMDLAIQLCDEILVMTPSKLVKGTPNELVEAGSFTELFQDEHIQFDAKNRNFVVK